MSIEISNLASISAGARPAGFKPQLISSAGPQPGTLVEPSGPGRESFSPSMSNPQLAMELRYAAMAGAVRRLVSGAERNGAPRQIEGGHE